MLGIYYPDTLYGTIFAIPLLWMIYSTIRYVWWEPYVRKKYTWRKCDGCKHVVLSYTLFEQGMPCWSLDPQLRYDYFNARGATCTYGGKHNPLTKSEREIGCERFEKYQKEEWKER